MRKALSVFLVTLTVGAGLMFTRAAPEKSAAFTAYERWRSEVLTNVL